MITTEISGIGMYVPPKVVTNHDLAKIMETSDEFIRSRTGIIQRHWVEGTTSSSDLALEASKEALKAANLKPSDLDMILLATVSPDYYAPGTACFLQAKLDVPGIPAIDVRQQCSGFVYGLAMADMFMKSGNLKHILLVGAEAHSKLADKSTQGRKATVLWGDGAGAVILSRGEYKGQGRPRGIISTHLHADGRLADLIWIKACGSANEGTYVDHGQLDRGEQYAFFDGKRIADFAAVQFPAAIQEAMDHNGLTLADVDLFVLHQANLRLLEGIAATLKIPPEKMFNTVERYGNSTAATIPIGLYEAVKAGRLKPGMRVIVAALGGGVTWGSGLIHW